MRSAVAKNAIMALGDIFLGLGKNTDPEITGMVAVLVKVAVDTYSVINIFIVEMCG